jgi:hypothetical protein
VKNITVELSGGDYSHRRDGVAKKMESIEQDRIEWLLQQAIDDAADRCEMIGGDMGELHRIRDNGPPSMKKVRKIQALYRRRSFWDWLLR